MTTTNTIPANWEGNMKKFYKLSMFLIKLVNNDRITPNLPCWFFSNFFLNRLFIVENLTSKWLL